MVDADTALHLGGVGLEVQPIGYGISPLVIPGGSIDAMKAIFTLLLSCLAIAGCGESHPPLINTGDDRPPAVGIPEGGLDAGMDSSADASADSGVPPIFNLSCTEVSSSPNRIVVSGTTLAAQNAYATWVPNECSPVRDVQIGFDSDACGTSSGDLLSFSIDAQTIDDDLIVLFSPITITPPSFVTVRLHKETGETWGNCASSSGQLTFQSLSTTDLSSVQATFNIVLTDCGSDGLTPITVEGTLSVALPVGCTQ